MAHGDCQMWILMIVIMFCAYICFQSQKAEHLRAEVTDKLDFNSLSHNILAGVSEDVPEKDKTQFDHLPDDIISGITDNDVPNEVRQQLGPYRPSQGWWQDAIDCSTPTIYCKPKDQWIWPY